MLLMSIGLDAEDDLPPLVPPSSFLCLLFLKGRLDRRSYFLCLIGNNFLYKAGQRRAQPPCHLALQKLNKRSPRSSTTLHRRILLR
jgi:hypothetical protein